MCTMAIKECQWKLIMLKLVLDVLSQPSTLYDIFPECNKLDNITSSHFNFYIQKYFIVLTTGTTAATTTNHSTITLLKCFLLEILFSALHVLY